MLCQFLLYKEVNQLCVYICPLPLEPPSPLIPPLQVITEHELSSLHMYALFLNILSHTYALTVTHNYTHSQTYAQAQMCEHTTWSMTQLPEGDLHSHYSSLFPSFNSTAPMIVIIIVHRVPPCSSHSARCSLYILSNTRNQQGRYCDPFHLKCRRPGFNSWVGKIPW